MSSNTINWLDQVTYETSLQRQLDNAVVRNHLVEMELTNPRNLPIIDTLMTEIVNLQHFDIRGVGGWSKTAPSFHIQLPPPHEQVYVVLAVTPLKTLDGIRVRLQQRIPGSTEKREKLLRYSAELNDGNGIESVIRYLRGFI